MLTSRSILPSFLVALLLLTSGAMASARGTMRDATGAMVLCTGAGTVTVLIGADGAPIEPAHICPDCALSFIPFNVAAFSLASSLPAARTVDPFFELRIARGLDHTFATARSPPRV